MPIRAADLEASLDQLSRLRATESDPRTVVTRVVTAAKELFGVDGAGMLVVAPDEALHRLAETDERGHALEVVQEETGQGPCVDAYVLDSAVTTPDLPADERYPVAGRRLATTGIRGVLGVPVRLGGGPVGTLDVYRLQVYHWAEEEITTLQAYARVIGDLLEASIARHRSDRLAAQLRFALDYRVPIERAIGYLMADQGVRAVEAFTRLRSAARNSRRKVVDVAADVLAGKPLP